MKVNEFHELFRSGNITEDEMFDKCIDIIHHAIHKSKHSHTDDIFQESCIATLECIRKYKGTESFSFITMVYKAIKWRLIKYTWLDKAIKKPVGLYYSNKDRKSIPVVASEIVIGKNTLHLADKFRDDEAIDLEEGIVLSQAINSLDSKKRDILNLYSQGYVLTDIAKMYGVSFGRIGRVLSEARIELCYSKYLIDRETDVSVIRRTFSTSEIGVVRNNLDIMSNELAEALNKPVFTVYKLKNRLKRGDFRD